MAQTLLAAGYSPDNIKVLLGGWTSWQTAGYPSETSGAGAQPIQPVPGATLEMAISTAVPAGSPTP